VLGADIHAAVDIDLEQRPALRCPGGLSAWRGGAAARPADRGRDRGAAVLAPIVFDLSYNGDPLDPAGVDHRRGLAWHRTGMWAWLISAPRPSALLGTSSSAPRRPFRRGVQAPH
jgi:hypothetical protein